MVLPHVVQNSFYRHDRDMGDRYFQASRVSQVVCLSDGAEARVRGTRFYRVAVDWSDVGRGLLSVVCDCPRFHQGVLCKHVWALLRVLDQQGQFPGRLPVGLAIRALERGEPDGIDRALDQENATEASGAQAVAFAKSPPVGEPWYQLARLCHVQSVSGTTGTPPLSKRRYWWVLQPTEDARDGTVRLHCLAQRQRKAGGWGQPQSVLPQQGPYGETALLDAKLSKLVQQAARDHERASFYRPAYHRYRTGRKQDGVVISAESALALLPELCRHDRFVWLFDISQPIEDARTIRLDQGAVYRFVLEADRDGASGGWIFRGMFQRPGESSIPVSDAVSLIARRFVLFENRLARFQPPAVPEVVSWFRQRSTVCVPEPHRLAFLQALVHAVDSDVLDSLPSEVLGSVVSEPMQAELQVEPGRHQRSLNARGQFRYADVVVQPDDRPVHFDPDSGVCVRRDLAAECKLVDTLRGALISSVGYEFSGNHLMLLSSQLPKLVRTAMYAGWRVCVAGQVVRRPGKIDIAVKSGIDWFELHGNVDFDGLQVPLPQLLRALRTGQATLTLDDGTRGLLPERWLEKYSRLLKLGDEQGDVVHYRPSQAMLLDAMLAEQDSVTFDRRFATFQRRLASFQGVRESKEPRGFRGTLRSYQRRGLGWLKFLNSFRFGGCLADDMGLGKTVQVLALLQSRRTRRLKKDEQRKPSIVVVPKSLVFNWINEAARFAPRLRVLDYTGLGRKELRKRISEQDVVVTTYGVLRRDIEELKKTEFDYAILDEATVIKNPRSQNAKSCRLISADYRLAMTGTPIENHLGELWSLFEFLNPGMLGAMSDFQAIIAKTGSQDGRQWLARAISPYVLRRTNDQVLTDLPKKTEKTIYCRLTSKQKAQYSELRGYYRRQLSNAIKDKGLNRSKIHVLEALLRLRQAACHPGLIDSRQRDGESAKLSLLMEYLREAVDEKHKVLVFSQFTTFLGIVRNHLEAEGIEYEYLDGRTRNREESVDRFQEEQGCSVFLISLKAGGHGLNLTAADYVFVLDPWWNPAVEAQAIDRAHRIGQTRPVIAYRLIAQDTVEEKVLALQDQKRELADAIITANESLIRRLTPEDLQMLLG